MAVMLLKTYRHIPTKELKRRARSGDELANLLYKAVAYRDSLQILLWIIIGVSTVGFFLVIGHAAPTYLAVILGLGLVWASFAWLPYTPVTKFGLKLGRYATPPLSWLLQKLYPLLNSFANFTRRWRASFHNGIYEKEDLLDLLDYQAGQEDNRLSSKEIATAKSALTFGDKIVRDIMVSSKSVLAVSADDAVGPILMTELHDSGHSRFPVYDGKKSANVVGTLYLRDLLNIKSGGKIRDLMSKDVYYMHVEEPLDQALDAFLISKHHMFIVVNSLEDVVGVVTIEDVLEQIIGRHIEDEFAQYDDKHAVAKLKGHKIEKPIENDETVVES
jgi:CBS domain containing-hemolysin-like protein